MLLAAAAILALSGPAPRLLRFPAVFEDKLVFTYGSDIWESSIKGGLARRLTASGPDGYPYFSPDGKQLAFTGTYDGVADVYVMPADGGEPRRLTFEPEGDEVVGWTPDGKIAYVTGHGMPMARQTRLMLVDPKGGMPIRTPLYEVGHASFSPDGTEVAYDRNPSNAMHWRRYRGGSQGVISIYNLKSNAYQELPHGAENAWDPIWVGRTIYYESDKKSGTVNLFSYDLDAKKENQLTDYSDSDIKAIRSDGKQIVFERDGYLFDMNLSTQKIEQLSPQVLSDDVAKRPALKRLSGQITDFSLSPSGNRIAVAARGRIFTVPAHTGEIRAIASFDGVRTQQPSWSPDGKSIAYTSDASGEYQIYTVPQMGLAKGQKAHRYPTDPSLKIQTIDWMPDSLHMTITTLDGRLLLLDMASGAVKEIAKADPGITSYDCSPDSAWIAYVKPESNGFSAVWLYNFKTNKATRVTEGYYRDDEVSFDRSGKYLYFVSARTVNAIPGDFERGLTTFGAQRIYAFLLTKELRSPFAQESDEEPAGKDEGAGGATAIKKPKGDHGKPPSEEDVDEEGAKPTKIDLDGLSERIVPLPMPAGQIAYIAGGEHGLFFSDGESLLHYELGTPEPQPILEAPRLMVTFNANRTKMAYYISGVLGVVEAHPGIRPFEGRTDLSGLETVIDPRKEWQQMYWDAWRWERDAFYDPKFTGVDWKAVGQKYATYLDSVSDRNDLNYVIGMMIGELGTSHAYVQGGDSGGRGNVAISVGQLGADYEVANGKVRFKRIYRGLSFDETHRSPLGEPGLNIKDGDYLLQVNGIDVPPDKDPDALLVDKANRSVTITVNDKPSLEGARELIVKPLATESELRYADWVEENRKTVSKLSGGRIGYMHVPDTDAEGIVGFVKGFYSQSDKQALVVDERWNSGGDIPTFFTEKLARTAQAIIKDRYGRDVRVPEEAIEGPKVLLINGYAGSGGDMFAYLFRKQSLGQLIGTRTWGGLVGFSTPYTLMDGGVLTAPQFGLYDPSNGKWIAENHGIDPDIEVDLRPDLVAKGLDPQLEKAVQVLLEKLKKGEGVKPVKTPKYPDISKHAKN